MVELKRGEAKFVLACVESFASEFERGVAAVLAHELPGIEPPEVREVREQLWVLQRQLESRQTTIRVHEAMVGLIKRVLLVARSFNRMLDELQIAEASCRAIAS